MPRLSSIAGENRRGEPMTSIQFRVRAAATGLALTAVLGAACTRLSIGGSTLLAPTPASSGADAGPVSTRGANSEAVCHFRGNGAFALLQVSANAVAGHLGHGDGRPLGTAP